MLECPLIPHLTRYPLTLFTMTPLHDDFQHVGTVKDMLEYKLDYAETMLKQNSNSNSSSRRLDSPMSNLEDSPPQSEKKQFRAASISLNPRDLLGFGNKSSSPPLPAMAAATSAMTLESGIDQVSLPRISSGNALGTTSPLSGTALGSNSIRSAAAAAVDSVLSTGAGPLPPISHPINKPCQPIYQHTLSHTLSTNPVTSVITAH